MNAKADNKGDALAEYILEHYLQSSDFNGVPITAILSKFGLSKPALLEVLSKLITQRKISLVYGDRHPNPHIKAFPDEEIEEQLRKLPELHLKACAYPAKEYPKAFLDPDQFTGKPYDYELALGAAQLEFRAFDLSVLEIYKNDPRYLYDNWDIGGRVCISDDFFETDDIAEHDQVLLQTFGFCYNKNIDRAVAVFLRYLKDLSPEHQQIWKAKELSGEYSLHPDYHRTSLIGDFPERYSLADAFLLELHTINEMCALIGKPSLFKETFKDNKPRGFGFLVRPTLKEFNEFVHILDKMMSDNLNRDFFKTDMSMENEETRKDGKVVVTQKGTISLLDEWFNKFFCADDTTPLKEMISTFRNIRNMRQKPAHAIHEDKFDQKFFHDQRKVFIEAYRAISTIRHILAFHPSVEASNFKINPHLLDGKIWTF